MRLRLATTHDLVNTAASQIDSVSRHRNVVPSERTKSGNDIVATTVTGEQ
jgi:hypothetical protein